MAKCGSYIKGHGRRTALRGKVGGAIAPAQLVRRRQSCHDAEAHDLCNHDAWFLAVDGFIAMR